MIPALKTTIDDLSKISDAELQMMYYDYKDCIELIAGEKLVVGDKSEHEIKMQFRKIVKECESRFHVSVFPMSS